MSVVEGGRDEASRPVEILICVNRRLTGSRPSCGARGGEALLDALTAAIADRGLRIPVHRICCFGRCSLGANVRIAPGGQFFHHATEADVDAIVAAAGEQARHGGPERS